MPDLICSVCFGPMTPVTVHHAHMPATVWRVCPVCLTTRHIDANPTSAAPPARHLRAVP